MKLGRVLPAVSALAASAAAAAAAWLPGAPKCAVFPQDNPWNQQVDRLPVDPSSSRYIAAIGLDAPVHPDFGTAYAAAPKGIAYAVVSNRTRRVPLHFRYVSESGRGPYPIPRDAPIEGIWRGVSPGR